MKCFRQNGYASESTAKKAKHMTELELFDAVFPDLVSLLCDSNLKDNELAPAAEWFQEVRMICLFVQKDQTPHNSSLQSAYLTRYINREY